MSALVLTHDHADAIFGLDDIRDLQHKEVGRQTGRTGRRGSRGGGRATPCAGWLTDDCAGWLSWGGGLAGGPVYPSAWRAHARVPAPAHHGRRQQTVPIPHRYVGQEGGRR